VSATSTDRSPVSSRGDGPRAPREGRKRNSVAHSKALRAHRLCWRAHARNGRVDDASCDCQPLSPEKPEEPYISPLQGSGNAWGCRYLGWRSHLRRSLTPSRVASLAGGCDIAHRWCTDSSAIKPDHLIAAIRARAAEARVGPRRYACGRLVLLPLCSYLCVLCGKISPVISVRHHHLAPLVAALVAL
jgi:hypothetical protein